MSTDILSTIDRAIGCQTCEGDLTGSVSDDFCSEACQIRWHAGRVEAAMDSPDSNLPGVDWTQFGTTVAQYAESFAALGVAMRQATVACAHLLVHRDGTVEQVHPLGVTENGNDRP